MTFSLFNLTCSFHLCISGADSATSVQTQGSNQSKSEFKRESWCKEKKKKPKEHRQHTHSTDSQTKIKHYTVSHSSGNQPLDTQTCFQAGKADKSKITQAVLSLDVSNPASFCSFPSMRRSEHFSLMVCPGPFCTKPSSSGGCCLAFSPWNCDIWHELRCLPTTLQPLCS